LPSAAVRPTALPRRRPSPVLVPHRSSRAAGHAAPACRGQTLLCVLFPGVAGALARPCAYSPRSACFAAWRGLGPRNGRFASPRSRCAQRPLATATRSNTFMCSFPRGCCALAIYAIGHPCLHPSISPATLPATHTPGHPFRRPPMTPANPATGHPHYQPPAGPRIHPLVPRSAVSVHDADCDPLPRAPSMHPLSISTIDPSAAYLYTHPLSTLLPVDGRRRTPPNCDLHSRHGVEQPHTNTTHTITRCTQQERKSNQGNQRISCVCVRLCVFL
jgi:hypothetical protein